MGTQWIQNGGKIDAEESKRESNWSFTPQDAPDTPPDAPNTLQDAPDTTQDAPDTP